ncbi:hypothetical protein ILYODFUR_004790 [Ilyodon furcidens]|uniref:Uncharacterized protein n=1 Tax=Ilyodon furcidens TaxID=33524 RepID=A0ABV0U3W4_9TELE
MGEPQQQRKPGPHQPKPGYQQKLVPILEKTSGVSGRSGGMGERHKEGFGPTHAPMRCSPKDWHCPSGRTRGDSELRPWSQTGPAVGHPNAIHHLLVKPPLPRKGHLPR